MANTSAIRLLLTTEATIGLEGIESDGRWRVVLHADGEDVAFPPEPTAQELLEEVRIRHPFHGEGPEAGWSMPWESPRFVAAANRVWPAAESALQRAAQGRRAVVLECVETESAPIRFGYVVAVLDILLAEGVEVVRFEPEGLALRFDVPPIPEPLPAWQPPEIPPGRLLWIVGILGALFAIVVSGQTRPRSGAGA